MCLKLSHSKNGHEPTIRRVTSPSTKVTPGVVKSRVAKSRVHKWPNSREKYLLGRLRYSELQFWVSKRTDSMKRFISAEVTRACYAIELDPFVQDQICFFQKSCFYRVVTFNPSTP